MIVLDAILALIVWTILAILTWPDAWPAVRDNWRRWRYDRKRSSR